MEAERNHRRDALELALQVVQDQHAHHSQKLQDKDAEFSKFEEELLQHRQALDLALQVMKDREEHCANALEEQRVEHEQIFNQTLEEQRAQHKSALELALQVMQDREDYFANALEEQRAEHECLFNQVLEEQRAQHRSELELAFQVLQDKDEHVAAALEEQQAQHKAELERVVREQLAGHEVEMERAMQEHQAHHQSTLDLAHQIVQDKDDHHARTLEDHHEQFQSEMERALQAQRLQHQSDKNAQQQNHVREKEVKVQELQREAQEREVHHERELQALREAHRLELDTAMQAKENEAAKKMKDMEKVWEQRFEKRSKVLLACLREAVQVMEEVTLEVEFAPLVRERKEDFVYELSMATFPVVCLDASPSTTPLMVTLAAFEVEALGKAMDGGVELQTFGRCQKVPSERATSGSWALDTAARGGTGTTELLEPLGGQRGGFDKVEPESWLQTVRLRDQLEEEHRQMRLLDAKLQAIVKERCRHEGFPRLADMEDSLEPEPDVDDMLLLPLHINEVLRVLREAHRSPVQSDVICVPLRLAQMSVAVGEALEETKSRSSCAALSEVSLLLYQLSGKEVPEPTLAPQEGRCGSPRTIGSFAGRRPGEPPARFPKPRPSGANA